ncbi:MAG: HutD family protein [Rhodobacteraceae bacterium]|nr:HutD family protein [Paracoccaceae bacterium]
MIRHLSAADFRPMPWANGKGVTVEMARADGPGGMLWRLSRASVVENGPFSIFPGVERNLTVLTGPGFDLVGEGVHLAARPMLPVAFAGDVAVRAEGVSAPSDDFNVMTARALPRPQVRVLTVVERLIPPPGGLLAVYRPDLAELILTDEPLDHPGAAIAVFLNL